MKILATAVSEPLQIHPSMFISQKSQIRNMEHTLVQSKSECGAVVSFMSLAITNKHS